MATSTSRDAAAGSFLPELEHALADGQPDAASPAETRSEGETLSVFDGWEVEERLRHVGRVLGKNASRPGERPSRSKDEPDPRTFRIDAAHSRHTRPHQRQVRPAAPEKAVSGFLGVVSLFGGLAALACGGVLLGWSHWADRPELWTVGLPIALAGLAGLIVALVLRIERLGRENSQTVAQLDRVGNQLRVLRGTTEMMSTAGQHSPSNAFYAHLADGAGPKMLLSDLKSQLDLLAVRMSGDESLAEEE